MKCSLGGYLPEGNSAISLGVSARLALTPRGSSQEEGADAQAASTSPQTVSNNSQGVNAVPPGRYHPQRAIVPRQLVPVRGLFLGSEC